MDGWRIRVEGKEGLEAGVLAGFGTYVLLMCSLSLSCLLSCSVCFWDWSIFIDIAFLKSRETNAGLTLQVKKKEGATVV